MSYCFFLMPEIIVRMILYRDVIGSDFWIEEIHFLVLFCWGFRFCLYGQDIVKVLLTFCSIGLRLIFGFTAHVGLLDYGYICGSPATFASFLICFASRRCMFFCFAYAIRFSSNPKYEKIIASSML